MLCPHAGWAQGAFCRPLTFLWLGAGDGLRQTNSVVLQTPSSLAASSSEIRLVVMSPVSSGHAPMAAALCSRVGETNPLGHAMLFYLWGHWAESSPGTYITPRSPGLPGCTEYATMKPMEKLCVSHLLKSIERIPRGKTPWSLVSPLAHLKAYNPFRKHGDMAQHKAGRNKQSVEVV